MTLQNNYCGVTIDEMSEKLERPRRAIERLMEVIREKFGDSLELVPTQRDRKKHWRLKKGTMNFLVTFSDLELSRLQRMSESLKSEADKKSISNIIEKIRALNPVNNHKTDIDILLEAQGYAVRQYPKEDISSEIMNKIAYAIQSEQKLKISYTDGYGNFYETIIEPYGFKIGEKHYLIAKEDKIKTFLISRIKSLEILDGEYYEKDEDFDIQEYCNLSFGIYTGVAEDVILEFNQNSAKSASNYHFHPTQKGEWNDDGSYTLTFHAGGNYEIITELLKWRESVKIISPQSLKDEYNKTVKLMYENIKKG